MIPDGGYRRRSHLALHRVGETNIRGWLEPHVYRTTQTIHSIGVASQLLTNSRPQADTPIVRNTDVAYAFVSDREDLTYSPWQKLCLALAPLQAASDAVLENISNTLDYERDSSAREKHAGLTAVARLVDLLGLRRPTILRMGGVPSFNVLRMVQKP